MVIAAPSALVLKAFFEAEALSAWWQVVNSVTTPRALGPYAVEWGPTEIRDDEIRRLGGVFRGTVLQVTAGHGFAVADAFWLPPDGDPIGPMALEVTLTPVTLPDGASASGGEIATNVHVAQTGFEEDPRWRRFYDIMRAGWERALKTLKMLLEK